MKRVISRILSLCIACGTAPLFGNIYNITNNYSIIANAEEYNENTDYTEGTYEYLNYKKYSDYIEISGYDRAAAESIENLEIIIPAEIENLPVKVIGKDSLSGCSMTAVQIPDTVETIGDFAFLLCENIEKIDIPEGVKNIGNYAFEICYSLYEVNIPQSVENIGLNITGSCTDLSEINVNENNPVYSSENGILYNKDKTALLRYPVRGVPSECIVPDGIKTIGVNAFDDCQFLDKIVLPQGLEVIEDQAFDMCCNMSEIVIPNGVVSIGVAAFRNCTALVELNIPASVEIIGCGSELFWNCVSPRRVNALTAINVAEDNKNYSSENGVFFNKDKTILYKYPASKEDKIYNIPETVEVIDEYVFDDCVNLEEITIPDGVTEIKDCTFSGCINLKNLTIPPSVTTINNYSLSNEYSTTIIGYTGSEAHLFANEKNLEFISNGIIDNYYNGFTYEITDNNGKETISITACTLLTEEIEIPSNINNIPVTEIRCSFSQNLINLIIPSSIIDIFCWWYDETNLTITGYTGSYADIYAQENEIEFISIGEVDNYYNGFLYEIHEYDNQKEITIIDSNLMKDRKITVPSVINDIPVTSISENAFFKHTNLEEIIFPESIGYFGLLSVNGCNNLKSITVLNPECSYYLVPFDFNENTTLYCYENSTMHEYAQLRNKNFRLINASSTENITGDVNGDYKIDISDASDVLTIYALTASNQDPDITENQRKSADVNNDGVIDISDASAILAYYAYDAVNKGNNMTIEEFIKSRK